jgi:pimeloyl-ACP methyl ester carboxylesterase
MTQKLIFPIFLLLTLNVFAQTNVEGTSYSHFQITSNKDTIDFVVADTNLWVTKPLLLFCQGSLPVPLFINIGENRIWPATLSNFNLEELNKNYHVAVISKPKTPLIVNEENLNPSSCYVTDTANPYSFSEEYTNADYLENYVNRANKVLKFLKKQKWIASERLVVAGHSQGGPIATQIALQNEAVTELGLFGVDPFGLIDIAIRRARLNAQLGRITWEEADSTMTQLYEEYKVVNNVDSVTQNPKMRSLQSFSKPFYDDLLKLKIPIYMAYGTEDIIADLCDLMPLFFIEKGKTNLTLKRYLGMDHNFFEVDEDGRANHDKAHWIEVMQEFVNWIK